MMFDRRAIDQADTDAGQLLDDVAFTAELVAEPAAPSPQDVRAWALDSAARLHAAWMAADRSASSEAAVLATAQIFARYIDTGEVAGT